MTFTRDLIYFITFKNWCCPPEKKLFITNDTNRVTKNLFYLQPETIPQACIDMTKVLEVTSAEDVTGHLNSLAVTAPDRVTFVKGTCPEEAKWWLNILSAFPKTKVNVSLSSNCYSFYLFIIFMHDFMCSVYNKK